MKKFLISCILAMLIAVPAAAQTAMRISDAADSIVLKAYADTSTRSVCFTVKDYRPDSVVIDNPKAVFVNRQVSTCLGYNGTVEFIRDTAVEKDNIDYLNELMLERYPYLIMVCGGRRMGPGWSVVPECRVRLLKPIVEQ